MKKSESKSKSKIKFVPGKVLEEFDVVKGSKIHVKFRFLKRNENVEEITKYINSIVTEKENWLSMVKPVTVAEERKWLKIKLKEQAGKNKYVVVEADGKFLGNAELRCGGMGNSHTASFGISLARNICGMGVGTRLLKYLINMAKKMSIEILYIEVYKGNKRALHIYQDKLGFKQSGIKPKFRKRIIKGKAVYDDEVFMWRRA
ncbi:MAG: GNAT family N-acetyltransferase [Candidatus Aenigmatarchaeota archaeon]